MGELVIRPGSTALAFEADLQGTGPYKCLEQETLIIAGVRGFTPHTAESSGDSSKGAWLENGGYIGVLSPPGRVPEYTAGAAPGVRDTVAGMYAGMAVMCKLAEAANGAAMYLHSATSVKGRRTSMSMRQHYAIVGNHAAGDVMGSETLALSILDSYRATRPLWAGAGLVSKNGYRLSQRADAIGFASSMSMLTPGALHTEHGKKAMGVMRTGFSADLSVDFSSDPLFSAPAALVDVAITRIIIKLAGYKEGDIERQLNALRIVDPVRALHQTSADLTLRKTSLLCADRKQLSARDWQKALLDLAASAPERIFSEEERAAMSALEELLRVVDKINPEQGIIEPADGVLAWATRLGRILSSVKRGHGEPDQAVLPRITDANVRALAASLRWDRYTDDDTAGSSGMIRRTAMDAGLAATIDELTATPPAGTLAARRGAALGKHRGNVAAVGDYGQSLTLLKSGANITF